MAGLSLDTIGSLILKGNDKFAIEVNKEFINLEYNSNSDVSGQLKEYTRALYYLTESLQFRVNRDIIDETTICLYKELERRLGTYIDNNTIDPNYLSPPGTILVPVGNFTNTFLALTDTPDTYIGQQGKLVEVNSDATGLDFIDPTTLIPNITADNGLTLNGTEVDLGGVLIRDTTIYTSTNGLSINGEDTDGNQSVSEFFSDGYNYNLSRTEDSSNSGIEINIGANNAQLFTTIGNNSKDIDWGSDHDGISILDQISSLGLVYQEDYSTIGTTNSLWIPNWGAVTNAISNTAVYFGTGTFTGLGTSISPYFLGSTNGLTTSSTLGIELGGNLIQNTTISPNGHELYIDQNNSANNILNFRFSGSTVGFINTFGNMYLNGLGAFSNVNDASITMNSGGLVIARNQTDSTSVTRIVNKSTGSTGDILGLLSPYRTVFGVSVDGTVTSTGLFKSNSAVARGYNLMGGLKPLANSDTLIGLDINATFGTSTISSLGSFTAGSGYPDGVKDCNTTGGTGTQCSVEVTISGGVVIAVSLLQGGINYTNGDTLTIVVLDSSGIPIGSGATVIVSGITSYTGLTNLAARFSGAPILLNTISTPITFSDGMMWQDGTHLYIRLAGVTHTLI